ncbi:MAG: hypothetical protein E7047_06175 [Lentisphaerae bacterium]|nr:hypothetical protein [Lentisphaerota bacterium]
MIENAVDQKIMELDSINVPLSGMALIEAAAGTGKTHNIQSLAARLVVEKGFAIGSIVIVTFTDLAARELADRLRLVLEDLHSVLQGKKLEKAERQQRAEALVARFDCCGIARDTQLERTANALRDFDEKCVSTIHGFCSRVLSENAFESSVAFRTRLEKNVGRYIDKLLTDYCRTVRYSASQLPRKDELTPDMLKDPVCVRLNRPDLVLEYNVERFTDESELFNALTAQIAIIQSSPGAADQVRKIPGKFNKIGNMSGAEHIAFYADRLQELLDSNGAVDFRQWYEVLKNISLQLLDENIYRRSKDNLDLVQTYLQEHDLFAVAQKFCSLMDISCKLYYQDQAYEFVRSQLAQWKQQDNFHDFNDLLMNLHNALNNEYLCSTLRNRYNAAIIDEFQDTDAVQYDIFHKIFVEKRAETVFFMVGDPRQAIYAFRGGDIAAYMAVRQNCDRIYKLSYNYRSSKAMIGAFNRVFEHSDLFAASGLSLPECRAPESAPPGLFFDNKELEKPLQVCYLPELKADDYMAQWANAIVAVLNDPRYQLWEDGRLRPLRPGDLAVLAFDNYDLEKMRNLLSQSHVPVVCEHKKGIWSSDAAAALVVFLSAVLDYRRESLVREALLGDLCGMVYADLDRSLAASSEYMLQWQQILADLNALWHRSGISSMLSAALVTQWPGRTCSAGGSFKSRMACQYNGDRVITDYIQLGDMLAAAELNEHLPPRGVLNHLQNQIMRGQSDDESAEMLESDRTAVKLMTIHKSKGLQFPVVFLPFMAARYPFRFSGSKLYHRNGRLCCNPDQTDPEARELAGLEELQELMRLVYVAITRARSGCFIGWGKNSAKGTSPMDWLFRMRNLPETDHLLMARAFLKYSDELPIGDVNIPGDLHLPQLPEANGRFYSEPRRLESLIQPPAVDTLHDDFRLLSYSALLPHHEVRSFALGGDDIADYDQSDSDQIRAGEQLHNEFLSGGIWDIPGGAAIGNAWHKILEIIDFTREIKVSDVRRVLQMYNFDSPEYVSATCNMLNKLMEYQLPCDLYSPELQFCDKRTFCLKEITPQQKLCEFEFLLGSPEGINGSAVLEAMQDYLQSKFNSKVSNPGEMLQGGFFTGFIDLLFEYENRLYIVDYKSNTLGRTQRSFYGGALEKEMMQATYPVQYLCYTAAIVKYLEQRLDQTLDEELYEQYFGGVFYIFLRGMMLDEPGGVFADRPPLHVVKKILRAMESNEVCK